MHYFTSFLLIIQIFFLPSVVSSPLSSTDSQSVYAIYTLSYNDTQSTIIYINIQFPTNENILLPLNRTLTFIMPRSIPSGYNLQMYDSYVENLTARSLNGNPIIVEKESTDSPRWIIKCSSTEILSTISYAIDLAKQEKDILSAGDASKIRRDRYLGILGYSVYGYLEQMDRVENFPIEIIVYGPSEWPIHLTLPSSDTSTNEQVYGMTSGRAKNYYHLADSQVYMGPNINIKYISIPFNQFYREKSKSYTNTLLSFYVVLYTEDSYNLDFDILVDLSFEAMENLLVYYNSTPFLRYTVGVEMLKPLGEQYSYSFSMEHLNSCTISVDYGSGVNINSTKTRLRTFQYNIAHHIQHAWLPKRLFSKFYYPYTFEVTPVIDTIWFNEGFGQYIAMDAMANVLPLNESYDYRQYFIENRFKFYFNLAPLFIKEMSLDYLSMIGSTLYSVDFRTGSYLFASGALMAQEIDEFIQLKTQKQKSIRDVIIYMMKWSESNEYISPFTMKQFPKFFMDATNVDVNSILDKWLEPNYCHDMPSISIENFL
ncbi:unnamed protein product [Adineta steineri]|uniref:Peptidase M61 N-terminal domain-containing protein n=1 Tax=Adineta steineri TaxID=433720 RepID=A0A814FUG7_9BILA|nr:unnamed protein product [Adineta steineri]CAF3943313.1 unnamed protein product [Adineta steineri]